MVIGAPDVDVAVKSPPVLIQVVDDIASQIGGHAVVPDNHAVFAIPFFGGFEPDSPGLVGAQGTVFLQLGPDFVPSGVECTLADVVLKHNAGFRHDVLNVFQHLVFAPEAQLLQTGFVGEDHLSEVLGGLFGQIHDILAVVAPLGELRGFAQQNFLAPKLHREAKVVDLRTGIVDVVLSRNLVAQVFAQTGQHIAVNGAPGVADVQRAGGVGADVLQQDRCVVFLGAETVAVG